MPPAVTLPTGTRAVIDYSREPPIARAKIQVGAQMDHTGEVETWDSLWYTRLSMHTAFIHRWASVCYALLLQITYFYP